jgi:hypothetical protein
MKPYEIGRYWIFSLFLMTSTMAFTLPKALYGIPNSNWASSDWNWGYAKGTAHDCAKICRQKYSSVHSRQQLLSSLMERTCSCDVEELKLILALQCQRQRKLGDVVQNLVQANRYESEDDNGSGSHQLVLDLQERFSKLKPNSEDMQQMIDLSMEEWKPKSTLQPCIALVLKTLDFIECGM